MLCLFNCVATCFCKVIAQSVCYVMTKQVSAQHEHQSLLGLKQMLFSSYFLRVEHKQTNRYGHHFITVRKSKKFCFNFFEKLSLLCVSLLSLADINQFIVLSGAAIYLPSKNQINIWRYNTHINVNIIQNPITNQWRIKGG